MRMIYKFVFTINFSLQIINFNFKINYRYSIVYSAGISYLPCKIFTLNFFER